MKKKYKKKKIKTGVIAASAFGITATVVLAVVLLTTGIKEDTDRKSTRLNSSHIH